MSLYLENYNKVDILLNLFNKNKQWFKIQRSNLAIIIKLYNNFYVK
jgi:hypothetical protein